MSSGSAPKILLLQVRDHAEPQRQELVCFSDALGLGPDDLEHRNLVTEPQLRWTDVRDADLLILGGAGRHSATETYPFSTYLDDVLRRWIAAGRPFFGSCYGHHVLIRLYGGSIVSDKSCEEVGTFDVFLTESGRRDPLFQGLPKRFAVQLGHHDRGEGLPTPLLELARSARCGHQALRLADRPVYSTQFHPEISRRQMRDRLYMYRESYLDEQGRTAPSYEELSSQLRETPEAASILRRFVRAYA